MQRQVNQANNNRITLAALRIDHRLEYAFEVAALEGEQLIKGFLSLFFALGEDHLLHDGQAFLLHKHMLGAAEADALCPKGDRAPGIAGIVGVGPDTEAAVLVGPSEQFLQIGLFGVVGFDGLDDAREDFAGGTIDRNVVAFTQDEIGANDVEEMLRFVDADTLAACNAGQAESARNHCSVTGGAATGRENTFGNQHAVDIIGTCLRADQHDGHFGFSHCFGAVRVEDSLTAGCSR